MAYSSYRPAPPEQAGLEVIHFASGMETTPADPQGLHVASIENKHADSPSVQLPTVEPSNRGLPFHRWTKKKILVIALVIIVVIVGIVVGAVVGTRKQDSSGSRQVAITMIMKLHRPLTITIPQRWR